VPAPVARYRDAVQIGSSHPAVKLAQALQRGQSVPDGDNLTVAEGIWASQAVLDTGVTVREFLWCPAALRGPEAAELAAALSDHAENSYEISARTLERLADRDRPDGLLSIIELPDWQPESLDLPQRALILVSDGIEQPGNLGTLVRTLDACGADALVLTGTRTKRTNVKVFRASHGTILRIPTISFDSVPQAQTWLDEAGFQVYLADTDGASRYCNTDYGARTAIVMGNERYGISAEWYRDDAAKIFIPMLGSADSLNVSISAAVLLYEARSRLNDWRGGHSGHSGRD
jgi:tRNA G18 (ribose-2'-O)-methylase SpoU